MNKIASYAMTGTAVVPEYFFFTFKVLEGDEMIYKKICKEDGIFARYEATRSALFARKPMYVDFCAVELGKRRSARSINDYDLVFKVVLISRCGRFCARCALLFGEVAFHITNSWDLYDSGLFYKGWTVLIANPSYMNADKTTMFVSRSLTRMASKLLQKMLILERIGIKEQEVQVNIDELVRRPDGWEFIENQDDNDVFVIEDGEYQSKMFEAMSKIEW